MYPLIYNYRNRDLRFNNPIEPLLYTSKNVLKRENKREYWGPNSSNNTLRKQRNNARKRASKKASNNATSNNATRKKASNNATRNATPVTRKRRNAIFGI